MPLFSSSEDARTDNTAQPSKGGRLFSSWSRSSPPSPSAASRPSFFSRHSPFDDSNLAHDHSIHAARQKIHDAEAAEKEADKALRRARVAVKEAREHIKILEKEATAE